MDTKAKAEREVEDFNGMLKQVKAEREVEDFNGMLKQIEADIKALLVKKMAIKGVQRESMEARKEIEAEIAYLRSDRKLVLDLSLELAQPQEVPMVEVSSAESLPQEVSSRRSSAENLYGGPNLPSKPVDDSLLLARTDDCHNASVPTNGVNGTPSETSAFIERRPSKPSSIPSELPWLEVNSALDLEMYFEHFSRVARGFAIGQKEWTRMLSVRIRNEALALAYDKEIVQKLCSWDEAQAWWLLRVPKTDSADNYLRAFLSCKQGRSDINSHILEFDLRASRARMHQDGNLTRLFLTSLDHDLEEELRRTRLREELDAQRGGSLLPEFTLIQAQSMARSVVAALSRQSRARRPDPGQSVLQPARPDKGSLVCSFCSKPGHSENECKKKLKLNSTAPSFSRPLATRSESNLSSTPRDSREQRGAASSRPNQSARVAFSDERDKKVEFNGSCNLCKEWGHKAADCRRKPSTSRENGSGTKTFMVELDDDSCDDMPVITTDGSSDFDTEYEPVSAFAAKARSKALTTALCLYRCGRAVKTGLFALDSCCNENIFAPGLSTVLTSSNSVVVQAYGGQQTMLGPRSLLYLVNSRGENVSISGRNALDMCHLPSGCVAMLSRQTLVDLGVAVEFHMANPGDYLRIREPVGSTGDMCVHVGECHEEPEGDVSSFITEVRVKEYMDRERELPSQAVLSSDPLDEVRVCESLSQNTKDRLRDILVRYRHVFVPKGELPPPITGGPHTILLKADAKPVSCPQSKLTPSKAEFISRWVEKVLASGLYELAPEDCKYASRVHLASKEGPPGKERELFDIRVTGDYVAVNETIEKIPSLCPLLRDQTERFNSCRFFFETDGSSCYHQCELAEASRNILALRTPQGFLIRPCRLMEGMKNSGSVLQGRISRILSSIPPEVRQNLSNYMDDINGGVVEEDDLVTLTEETLRACSDGNFSLTARKTKLGFPQANFAGFEVGYGCRRLAEKHCAPLIAMREPENASELRSALGLFVQNREFIPQYAVISKPLNRLTGKVPWVFGETERLAFAKLKEACCARLSLANPDYSKPFHIDIDASDVGHGFMLYQLDVKESVLPVLYGSKCWSSNKEACRPVYYREGHALFAAVKACRFYIESSSFVTTVHTDHAPLQWVLHARRGQVTPWSIEEVADLSIVIKYKPGLVNTTADALSRYPIVPERPATISGVMSCLNPLLSALESSVLETEVVWVWAEDDTKAVCRSFQQCRRRSNPLVVTSPKATSYQDVWGLAIIIPAGEVAPEVCAALLLTGRPFCCLIPSDLVSWIPYASGECDAGIEARLLDCFKISFLDCGLTWVLSGTMRGVGHVVYTAAALKCSAGRSAPSKVMVTQHPEQLASRPEANPSVNRLVDEVFVATVAIDGRRAAEGKHVTLAAVATSVDEEKRVHDEKRAVEVTRVAQVKSVAEEKRVSEEKHVAEEKRVDEQKRMVEGKFVAEEKSHVASSDPLSNAAEVGEVHAEWPAEQLAELDDLTPRDGEVLKLASGLHVVLREGDTAKILVPSRRREALITQAHAASHHASWKKVLAALRNQYDWRGMTASVRMLVQRCASCALVKARRNLSHGQFASLSFDGPRVAYAMDFYEVAESQDGYKWILTIIDMFSREVVFAPMKSRQADDVVVALLRRVINVNGVPVLLLSDEAREFVGKVVGGLTAALGVQHITTRAYNPRANGLCERVHEFLGECLTRLPEEDRKTWDRRTEEFSFAHNTTLQDSIGCTPFEIGHGTQARTLVSSAALGVSSLDSCSDPNDADVRGYYGRLKASAALFSEVAAKVMSGAREAQNARLNEGSRVREFAIGDTVSIYFPKGATDDDWKPKHYVQWRGPMEVVKRLSETAYGVRETNSGQYFERTICNISPFRAPVVPESGPASAPGPRVGDMVALQEEDEFWIGEVKSLDVNELVCHYWSTTGRNVATANFKPAYIGKSTGKTILTHRLRLNEEPTEMWTGTCDLASFLGKVSFNVDKKGNHRLSGASRALLADFQMGHL